MTVLLPLLVGRPVGAQDPTQRYRILDTPHFRVHVRADQLSLGARAGSVAESAYAALASALAPPRRRIDLVVADHWDLSNGFATTYPVPRVVVYAAPPAGDPHLGSYDDWLRLVITHELVHIFHLDLARGWWRAGRAVLGRAPFLFPNQYGPAWLTEGLAVYYESRLTGAGRLDAMFHRGLVEAQAVERGPLPLDAAGGLSPRWPGGARPYAFGATWFGALAGAAGDSAVGRLVPRQAARLVPWVQLPQAVRLAAGTTLTASWRAFQDSAAARGAARAAGADSVRVLLAGQREPVPPRRGRDGRLLAIRSDGRDAAHLVLIDSGGAHDVARVHHVTGLAWDTGGAALVTQLEFVDPWTVRSDLWRITLEGHATRLTHGARLREIDVAPHGDVVAVRLVPGGTELVVVRGGRVRTLVREAGSDFASPRYSPGDGAQVAVVRVRGGWHDIAVYNAEGAQTAQLTRDATPDLLPAWGGAAGDPRVVWVREVEGHAAIVARRLRDSALTLVARTAFGALAPETDGDSVLFWNMRGDGYELARGADHGPSRPLAAVPAPPESLPPGDVPPQPDPPHRAWSPFPALLPQYWIPLVTSGDGATWIGALSTSTDPLGRWTWGALAQAGAGRAAGHLTGAIGVGYTGFRPATLDLSASRDALVYLDGAGAVTCCLPDESVSLGATTLRRRWRSLLSARGAVEYDRVGAFERWGLTASVAASSAQRPPLAISLQDGLRGSLSVRQRWRTTTGRRSTELVARASGYHAWGGGFARTVTAWRVAAGTIGGSDPVVYAVGGSPEEGVTLLPGVTLGAARSFPLRGAAAGEYAGRQVATASLEQRIPLALVGRGLPWLLPAQLDRIALTAFVDGAATRTDGTRAAYGAAGAELVLDLGVGYDLPLRLRAGAAQRLDRAARRFYVAAGSAF